MNTNGAKKEILKNINKELNKMNDIKLLLFIRDFIKELDK